MSNAVDLSKARYGMTAPNSKESPGGRVCPFEPTCWAEAETFLRLGYTVHEYRWDGEKFAIYQNFLPGDV
jgi:hypothetical protein